MDLCYFVDFTPFSPRVIQQRYARAGRANPRVRVGIAELGREGTTWVRFNNKPFEYIVRVKWLPDSRHISLDDATGPDGTVPVSRRPADGRRNQDPDRDGSRLGEHDRRPLLPEGTASTFCGRGATATCISIAIGSTVRSRTR